VTALFPRKPEPEPDPDRSGERGPQGRTETTARRLPTSTTLAGGERVVLGLCGSLAVLPVVGVLVSSGGAGLGTPADATVLSLLVVVGMGVGCARRAAVPERRRFRVPWPSRSWVTDAVDGQSRLNAVLTAVTAASLVLAGSVLAVGLLAPAPGPGYTDLSLHTRTDGGDLVSGNYPEELTVGETATVAVAVDNREDSTETYSLVVRVQRTDTDGETPTVVGGRSVDRRELTVADGQRVTETVAVTPRTAGEDVRVVYLLYRDGVPERPTVDNAYRATYLWIDVSESEEGG